VPEREGEQHNLILNAAYDTLVAQDGFFGLNQYAAVGTGSTPPAATQTTLVNEVARTRRNEFNNTGYNNTVTYTGTPGVYDIQVVRQFLESQVGGQNLTEWGFSPNSAANGALMCRELFRDGSNNPVVLTLASDQQLRLIYKFRVSLGPIQQTGAINISGIGNLTGVQKLHRYYEAGLSAYYNMDLQVASNWAAGNGLSVAVDSRTNPNWSYDSNVASWQGLVAKSVTPNAYVANSRQRTVPSVTFQFNEANQTITRVMLTHVGGGDAAAAALQFWFDSPFTKDNLHKLQFGTWTLTWGP
jgi:hypothetical protein